MDIWLLHGQQIMFCKIKTSQGKCGVRIIGMQNILLLHVTRIFNKWNYNNKDVSVQNNRYVRLKSLVVGYSLPQKWISKAEDSVN